MEGYLGQFDVDISTTPYKDFTAQDWALEYIGRYGGIDGAHHKDWVLDQVARILKGTPIIIQLAKWENGQTEYRFRTDEPTQEYHDWVVQLCDGEDGPNTYSYDEGIAP